MKKLVNATLLAVTASAMIVHAAAIEWYASFDEYTAYGPRTSMLDGSEVKGYSLGVTSPGPDFSTEGIGLYCIVGLTDDGKLVAANNQFMYGAFGVTLVLADIGSVVDYDSTVLSPAMLKFGCVPVENGIDVYGSGIATGDYAVDLSGGQTVYLGFAQNNNMGKWDVDILEGVPNYYYGWIGVGLDNGVPVVREFGADLTGAPVRVVAVPEPCAVGLVALGAVVLALRRPIRKHKR